MNKIKQCRVFFLLIIYLSACAGVTPRVEPSRLSIFDSRAYTVGYKKDKQFSLLLKLLHEELNTIEERQNAVASEIKFHEVIRWGDEFSQEIISEQDIKKRIEHKYKKYGSSNPIKDFLNQNLVEDVSHTYDLEGRAYILDDLADIYTRGLVDFKKAYNYNKMALLSFENIRNIGLKTIPVSNYYNENRSLYYYFFPEPGRNKIDTHSFYKRKNLVSDYPPEFLQSVRNEDFIRLEQRIRERKFYLDTKLGMVPRADTEQASLKGNDSNNAYISLEDLKLLEEYISRQAIHNNYYKNFYLASILRKSYNLGQNIDYEKLIYLCEEGLNAEAGQRLDADVDSRNLYYYYLGIAYLKSGKTSEGALRIEQFFEGLDYADELELQFGKKRKEVIENVIESEQKNQDLKKSIIRASNALGVTLVIAGAYVVATILLKSAGLDPMDYISSAPDLLPDAEKIKKAVSYDWGIQWESFDYKKSNLEGLVTPTTLKALRYLNKFELVELYPLCQYE